MANQVTETFISEWHPEGKNFPKVYKTEDKVKYHLYAEHRELAQYINLMTPTQFFFHQTTNQEGKDRKCIVNVLHDGEPTATEATPPTTTQTTTKSSTKDESILWQVSYKIGGWVEAGHATAGERSKAGAKSTAKNIATTAKSVHDHLIADIYGLEKAAEEIFKEET